MKKVIHTTNAPSAIGTYNQAIEAGDLLFTSGQIGIDPDTSQMVEGGIETQAKQVLNNIDAILLSVGLNKASILKLTVYLKDLNNFSCVNQAFQNYFEENEYPARSTVEVSELPMGALIEIDCIASRK